MPGDGGGSGDRVGGRDGDVGPVVTSAELHAAVHAAVTARLELARAATLHWDDMYVGLTCESTDAEYVDWVNAVRQHADANDPDATIRRCEADLERLAEHDPTAGVIALHWSACPCTSGVVCPELRRLAKSELGEVPNEVGGGG